MNSATASWKTTTLGILGALGVLFGQVTAVLDEDPETNLDLGTVVAALAVLGLGAAARDGNKSSQDHGIR